MSKTLARMNRQHLVLAASNKKRSKRQMQAVVAPLNRPPTIRSVNRKVKKIQNRQELKHVDKLFAPIELANNTGTSTMNLLNPLVKGDDNTTRDGDRVTFTSIQIKGIISIRPALLTSSSNWRIIVFRDLQANGATPSIGDLLDLSVITAPIYAPYNNDYTDRFRIISDKRGVINPNHLQTWTDTAGSNIGVTKGAMSIKYNLRWQLGFTTNYGLGNAGTVADISKNAVYLCGLSDQSAVSDFGAELNGGSRMYYKDD